MSSVSSVSGSQASQGALDFAKNCFFASKWLVTAAVVANIYGHTKTSIGLAVAGVASSLGGAFAIRNAAQDQA